MAELPTAYPLRDLFDAAVRHRQVRLTCTRCSHQAVFDAAALWWLFERNGWQDRIEHVNRRFYCHLCLMRYRQKVRRPMIEVVHAEVTSSAYPLPSELDWKRELRRRR